MCSLDKLAPDIMSDLFIQLYADRLWGTSIAPANYTVTVNYAVNITATWIAIGIGIIAPTDNAAKVVSNVYTETTSSSTKFRTEQVAAPSVRWFVIGR